MIDDLPAIARPGYFRNPARVGAQRTARARYRQYVDIPGSLAVGSARPDRDQRSIRRETQRPDLRVVDQVADTTASEVEIARAAGLSDPDVILSIVVGDEGNLSAVARDDCGLLDSRSVRKPRELRVGKRIAPEVTLNSPGSCRRCSALAPEPKL